MNFRFFSFTIAATGTLLVALSAVLIASCASSDRPGVPVAADRPPDAGVPAEPSGPVVYEERSRPPRPEAAPSGAAAAEDAARARPMPATQLRRLQAGAYEPALQARTANRAAAGMVFAQAGSLPPVGADEELWIIATPSAATTAAAGVEPVPGTGAMLARRDGPDDAEEIPLPLTHTDVHATINGYISTVAVTQQFENPFSEKIEAVYVFPLPEKAAVNEFLMVIGERRIRGILREKEEAAAIYAEARAQGYRASLLVQHRPNVFEQKVANIEPGKAIDVEIRYFHTLAYVDGWYSFAFPTVVGPRYNPPGHPDPIVPVPRGHRPDGTYTTVPYLEPASALRTT